MQIEKVWHGLMGFEHSTTFREYIEKASAEGYGGPVLIEDGLHETSRETTLEDLKEELPPWVDDRISIALASSGNKIVLLVKTDPYDGSHISLRHELWKRNAPCVLA